MEISNLLKKNPTKDKLDDFIHVTENLIEIALLEKKALHNQINLDLIYINRKKLMQEYNKHKKLLSHADTKELKKEYPFLVKRLFDLNKKLLNLTINHTLTYKKNDL